MQTGINDPCPCGTEEGRKKVIELLKSFENSEEHNKREGRPFYDVSWMWERLGLKQEEPN